MKEDILEQLVDDYLQSMGYFTRHNIKFKPNKKHIDFVSKQDSNHSDIDVIGLNPNKNGHERVMVVSCKSWQGGFRVESWLRDLDENTIIAGREAWRFLRELVKPKWSAAFLEAVEDNTGSQQFTYVLAVTTLIGDKQKWESHKPFQEALGGNPIQIIELADMLEHIEKMSTTTVASSDIGRVLQLMKAAKKGKKELRRTVAAQEETES